MSRTLFLAAVALAIGTTTLSGAALAAVVHPERSARYSGSGRLCENNAPGHRFTDCPGHDRFLFRTSAQGSHVTAFFGRIGPIYCGGGTNTITVKSMKVGADGSFGTRFSSPNVAFGKTTGTSHVVVRGKFTNAKTARVFYRLVTHFNNTPSSQDCGAQVSGTAHVR